MLRTVRDACKPHPSVFEDDPLDSIDDLTRAFAEGKEAGEFFARSHLTSGMGQLFDQGLRRLAGRSDQAVFELSQAMGGGKAHTLVAFGILAPNPTLRAQVVPDMAAAAPFEKACVVAFTGRTYPYFLVAQPGRGYGAPRLWGQASPPPPPSAQ